MSRSNARTVTQEIALKDLLVASAPEQKAEARQAPTNVKLYFARDEHGAIVDVSQVCRGLVCRCTCVGCGGVLSAKQGEKKAWHFAHVNAIPTRSCLESALHAAAKVLLKEMAGIQIPEVSTSVHDTDMLGREHSEEIRGKSSVFAYETCEVEYSIAGRRLDALVAGDKGTLGIEIKVTHAVDNEKSIELDRHVPVLEVDLEPWIDRQPDREGLKAALVSEAPRVLVTGANLLIASEIRAARARLHNLFVEIAQAVQGVHLETPKDLQHRWVLAKPLDLPAEHWPEWLNNTRWLPRLGVQVPRKLFGVHHTVWQAACAAYVCERRGYGYFHAAQVINGIGLSLGDTSWLDATTAVRAFLEDARKYLRIRRRGEDMFEVPMPGDARAVAAFFKASPASKRTTVAHYVSRSSIKRVDTSWLRNVWPEEQVFIAPRGTWQTHAWLFWIRGKVGRSVGVKDFKRWLFSRYPCHAVTYRDTVAEAYLERLAELGLLRISEGIEGWGGRTVFEYEVIGETPARVRPSRGGLRSRR